MSGVTTVVQTVEDLLRQVQAFRKGKEHHAHLRLWFRGHAKADWRLEPGVYRDDFQSKASEEERLLKERHLTQDFRVGSAGLRDPQMTDVDLYFLQQHYGMPTRLLDWTNNALTALYFAVFDPQHWNVDGAVIMMDAYQFAPDPHVGRGIATSRRAAVQEAVAVIARWDSRTSDAFPKSIIPVRPDKFDIRMSLQRAGFTFHVPDQRELTLAANPTLWVLSVSAVAKSALKDQLSALGTDDFAIYGDLESLSRHLKDAHKSR